MNYFQAHWQGRQSLGWSFWFNLVSVRVAVFLLQNSLEASEGTDFGQYRFAVVAGVVIFHVVLLIWQLVGVVCAAENHFAQNGNMALVWGTQLGCILMFILSAVYALGAMQMIMSVPENEHALQRMASEHASQYSLTFSGPSDSILTVSGNIDLGITKAVRAVLAKNPVVKTVVMDSQGGNIYEGRGLAQLFVEKKLNTHVEKTCVSACTVAFSGGSRRSAISTASFGFHQYRIDADYTIVAVDVEREQRRDEQRFLESGIDNDFVSKVFSQPSTSLWTPELILLLDASFLHEIVPADSMNER